MMSVELRHRIRIRPAKAHPVNLRLPTMHVLYVTIARLGGGVVLRLQQPIRPRAEWTASGRDEGRGGRETMA